MLKHHLWNRFQQSITLRRQLVPSQILILIVWSLMTRTLSFNHCMTSTLLGLALSLPWLPRHYKLEKLLWGCVNKITQPTSQVPYSLLHACIDHGLVSTTSGRRTYIIPISSSTCNTCYIPSRVVLQTCHTVGGVCGRPNLTYNPDAEKKWSYSVSTLEILWSRCVVPQHFGSWFPRDQLPQRRSHLQSGQV